MYATVQSNFTHRWMIHDRCSQEAIFLELTLIHLSMGRFIMIKKTFVSLLATLFFAGTIAVLTGCNTVEGAGKDIEKGGKAIKDEAAEKK